LFGYSMQSRFVPAATMGPPPGGCVHCFAAFESSRER
jgi:hypothetical protein